MEEIIRHPCPKCQKLLEKRSGVIDHFKTIHPEVESILIGKEKVNLKDG